MKTRILLPGLLALLAVTAHTTSGKYYGLWWDGATEHFVSIDPYTAAKTVIAEIPDVTLIDATFRLFDPDSSRYAFVGGTTPNAMSYHVIDAPTGTVISSIPRTMNLNNAVYSPGDRKIYGLWWSDSSTTGSVDSSGPFHPPTPHGTEYFAAIDPFTGAGTNTAIPGVKYIQINSHVLHSDSGRYVFAGQEDGGASYFYVIDVATGNLLSKIPQTMSINNPVYNPDLGAIHGLWWSDSSTAGDSSGPVMPPALHGTEYFVTFHADSSMTMTEIPGVKFLVNFNYTFDSDSGRYVFVGREASGPNRYYVIDVTTGTVISQTPVGDRVDHIVFAPALSTVDSSLYATSISPARGGPAAWSLRRAPDGATTLSFENPSGIAHAFSLHDVSGKIVMTLSGIRDGNVRLETAGMKAGVYAFRLRSAKGVAASGKLMIQ